MVHLQRQNEFFKNRALCFVTAQWNLPKMSWQRAKFLKELFYNERGIQLQDNWKKTCKNSKNMAKSRQEVNSLPLDHKNTAKRRKIIFACKLSKKRRQNGSQIERGSPCNSCWEWATLEKTGFLYPRIGSNVRVSDYNRSAIFFSKLCFFSHTKQIWCSTDCF